MTMKRNFLRLCLMLGLFSLNSCRQDLTPEKEAYNNSGAFQLTSKRISLDEAQHKSKLLPRLEQVETKFKGFSKTNAQGKVINYGNGVSIDTDDVTYIENGPNYHTYTFNIKRENAPADAPVENLVLSPLTDGTYRELLFSYNLTPQEKQILMNGGFVDTKNKVTVTDLQKGIFNSGGQLAKTTVCTWTIETHYTTCSEGLHSHGEPAGSGKPGTGTCAATTLSQLIVMVVGDCKAVGDDNGTPIGGATGPVSVSPGGLGNGEDDGSGNTDFPSNEPGNNCNGGLTAPQTPGYDISDGGCGGSIPSQPTLPTKSKTPCEKTKAMLANPVVQIKLDSLKNHSTSTGELGFKTKKDGTASGIINGGKHEVDMGIKAGYQGGYHNHTSTGIPMHSPPDIDSNLLAFARSQPTGEHKNAYFGMVVKKVCSGCPGGFKIYNYIMRFDGEYNDALTNFSQLDIDNFNTDYQKLESAITDKYGPYGSTYIDSMGKITNEGLEKLFFDTIKKMGLSNKVILQRIEDNGTVNNITLNPDGLHTTATPCL